MHRACGLPGDEPQGRAGTWQRPGSRWDERWRGTQRGEPQHAGDEQPGDLAGVRDLCGSPPHRSPQHPVLQRSCGLDAHQRHTQPGHVLASAHSEGDPLRDPGPGQGSPPHTLGADRLRDAVHLVTQVPQHLPSSAVPPHQLLHQIRPCALCRQHGLPAQRPSAQAAPVPRRAGLWHQQVLRLPAEPGDREGMLKRHEAPAGEQGEAPRWDIYLFGEARSAAERYGASSCHMHVSFKLTSM